MQYIKKNVFYIYHIFRMVFSSSSRFLLSVCELFIGILILTVGSIFMDSYYGRYVENANEFVENAVMLRMSSSEQFKNKIINEIDETKVVNAVISDAPVNVTIQQYTNGLQCALNARVVGITNMTDGVVFFNHKEEEAIPIAGELIYGRWLVPQDGVRGNRVVVIDSFTAKLLFGVEDSVGKKISFNREAGVALASDGSEESVDEYEIVGVFRNEQLTTDNEMKLNRFRTHGEKNLYLETYVYIPRLLLRDRNMPANGTEYYLWRHATGEECRRKVDMLNDYCAVGRGQVFSFDISTKEEVLEEVRTEYKPIKTFFLLLLFSLMIISGINTMSTMFFAIKERICEIGIKKALGATKTDICLQFLLEGVVMSLTAAVAAMVTAMFVSSALASVVETVLFFRIKVIYKWSTFLVSFIVATIYGLLFSFLPSYYGACINVTEALRFE